MPSKTTKKRETPQGLRPGAVLRSLSLNAERYKALKIQAVKEDISISELVDRLIAEYLERVS